MLLSESSCLEFSGGKETAQLPLAILMVIGEREPFKFVWIG